MDGSFNEALLELENEPFSTDDDKTYTKSLVAKYPEAWLGNLPWGIDLQAHYYEADSFIPLGGEVNVLNEPLPDPSGVTEEWGFTEPSHSNGS